MQVDWSGWAEQDRTPMQKGAVSADKSTEVDKAVEKEEGVRLPLLIHAPLTARCYGLGLSTSGREGTVCKLWGGVLLMT